MHYFEQDLREDGGSRLVGYVLDPTISTGRRKRRPALIIAPGGAYLTLATKEGEVVAARFLGLGFQTFVCRYLTYLDHRPLPGEEPVFRAESHYPEQVADLARSVAYVREHAEEWDIDPERVYVLGFSAGAHVCGTLAERFDDPEVLEAAGYDAADAALIRPSGVVLSYPMLTADPTSEGLTKVADTELLSSAIFGTDTPDPALIERLDLVRNVRADMPPVFVWHTTADDIVSPRETLAFVSALLEHGVACELHLYQRGPHGQSLCDKTSAASTGDLNPTAAGWVEAARVWMDALSEGDELSHA